MAGKLAQQMTVTITVQRPQDAAPMIVTSEFPWTLAAAQAYIETQTGWPREAILRMPAGTVYRIEVKVESYE